VSKIRVGSGDRRGGAGGGGHVGRGGGLQATPDKAERAVGEDQAVVVRAVADEQRRNRLEDIVAQQAVDGLRLDQQLDAGQHAVPARLRQGLLQTAHDPVRRGFHQRPDDLHLAVG
jgi:hypothetical protein